ncbi:MAG: SDR family NAD(P)-dependent oxidoreductase [Alphaproteobacteria bacterium]|nr:SDR family NAD(P)-dependent oxidoreductase [Alphaproteobacteria bacterium]
MSDKSSNTAPRVVVITGAGKGLGRAFALHAAANGARVLVNNRKRDGELSSADAVVAEIKTAGGEAIADYHDVRDDGAAQALAGAALNEWGRLDAIVLNAGVNGPAARFGGQASEGFRDVLETNFFANLAILHAVLPHVSASGAGRVVLVASSAGLYGVRGRAPYAASKGALIGLGLTLAHELHRDGVGVNVLAPYATTQMTAGAMAAQDGIGERMTPESVAPLATWLTSAQCDATGEIWVAGGGYVRRARMMEGDGAAFAALGDVAAALEAGRPMHNAMGFAGAEASFADFAAKGAL